LFSLSEGGEPVMLCTNSPRNKLTRVLGKVLVAHVD
jgi:hypothetical protein